MPFRITPRIAAELVGHEAIVTEAYRDAAGVWTWGVGITEASGHKVHPRYRDRPQSLRHCLQIYARVLRDRYLPAVAEVFDGRALSEAQVGAALSFHYNTGSLHKATWVRDVLAGEADAARASILSWNQAGGRVLPALTRRREAERDLFFDGKWSHDGRAWVIPISKPSYRPDPAAARQVDITGVLNDLFRDT